MYEFSNGGPGAPKLTVELTPRDREDATRLLSILLGGQQVPGAPDSQMLRRIGEAILEDRRKRSLIFNPSMFGEPAWELLLNLFVLDWDGPRLTVGGLAEVAKIPMTTALRWLGYLEAQNLVQRREHPNDARTAFISLTDSGRAAMKNYLSRTLTPGL